MIVRDIIVECILFLLPPLDVMRYKRVCKIWKSWISSDALWKRICQYNNVNMEGKISTRSHEWYYWSQQEVKNCHFQGVGKYTSLLGNLIAGDLVRGRLHGFGMAWNSDPRSLNLSVKGRDSSYIEYIGQWNNGLRHGHGRYIKRVFKKYSEIILSYTGEWKYGKYNGYGIYKNKGLHIYEGYFVKGKPTFGRITDKTGIYEGEVSSDFRRHGYGTRLYNVGSAYTGQWNNDARHGHGFYINKHTSCHSLWDSGVDI